MLAHAHRAYLGLAAIIAAVYFTTEWSLAYNVAGVGAAAAILVGIRLHRPRQRLGWMLVAAGQVVWALADFAWYRWEDEFPSPADAIYLAGYAALAAGIVLLIRDVARGAVGGHLDAALLAVCVGMSGWMVFVDGRLTGGADAQAVSLLYPAFDLVLLALLARLTFIRGRRGTAWWLLAWSIALQFLADCFYVLPALQETYVAGKVLDAGWLVSYALVGAAGLHPSMARLVDADEEQTEMPGRRILVLGLVLLTVPLAAIYAQLAIGHLNGVVVATVACPIIALIFARVFLLVRHVEGLREDTVTSERKFRAVFESAPIGISLGEGGMLTDTNPAFRRMLGYTAEELEGMHFRDVTHPDDVELANQDVTMRSEDAEAFRVDKRYIRKDGTVREAQVRLARPSDGAFAIGLIEDVTDRLALEEQLRQAQKMEAVGKLAGGIAHDFNNLMTAVMGYSDLLLGDLDVRQAERVKEIRKAAERASQLTRQLLAFSRKQMLQVAPLDLCAVVDEIEPLLARLLGEAVVLHVEAPSDEVVVVGDRTQLEQVLMNLAVNARDAMPGGGDLTIRVAAEHGEAVLSVTDTGVGMTADVRERIFEPFFSTKHPTEASGLGLSTVYGIVAQSGGRIDVVSAAGEGAEFVVRLPLASEAAVDGGEEPVGARVPEADEHGEEEAARGGEHPAGEPVHADDGHLRDVGAEERAA